MEAYVDRIVNGTATIISNDDEYYLDLYESGIKVKEGDWVNIIVAEGVITKVYINKELTLKMKREIEEKTPLNKYSKYKKQHLEP